tara:strand:- start:208 stop:411 length:204 start_codon:yes stop_codon:yes gene_type:complete
VASFTIAGRVFTDPDAIRIAMAAYKAFNSGKLAIVTYQGNAAIMRPGEAICIASLIEAFAEAARAKD